MFKDVMTDIETLGTKPGCIILSIGAVIFDPHDEGHDKTFYRNVDIKSCEFYGLTKDPETVKWWEEQSPEARAHLIDNCFELRAALKDYEDFFKTNNCSKIWCQGATFDAPILEEAFRLTKIETPWEFWAVRDTRTVYDVCKFDTTSIKREGTYHNALDDAIHQVKLVQGALRNVR